MTTDEAHKFADQVEHIAMLASTRSLRPPTGPDIDRMDDAKAKLAVMLMAVPTMEISRCAAHLPPRKKGKLKP